MSDKTLQVPGTEGYEQFAQVFIQSSQALRFEKVCHDFLPYLPEPPARVLDLGAGAGQNAASLAKRGHDVTAIEPLAVLLEAAKSTYAELPIRWQQDSLPDLSSLRNDDACYGFVLLIGVWHHLQEQQRAVALEHIARLLCRGGRCAISLRNGPAGVGSRVYATSAAETIAQAKDLGLHCVLDLQNQPSIMPNKNDVTWARLLFEKP